MNCIMRRAMPGLVATMLAFSCLAQNYPNRPLKLFVPMAPGGANDVFAPSDQIPAEPLHPLALASNTMQESASRPRCPSA